jgi:hypothetical protein
VWVGLPPAPVAAMDYAHLLCLTNVGGELRATLCGAAGAASWQLQRAIVATARAPLGGGALRLIDIDGDGRADLCAASADGSRCALGDGTGAFTGAVAGPVLAGSDDGTAPPSSGASGDAALPTWTGDLDGDGVADWCAAGAAGPLCSVSAEHVLTTDPAPWAFSQAGVIEAGASRATSVLGDVTGDGRADLCSLLPDRVSCAMSTGRGFAPRTKMLTFAPGFAPDTLLVGDLDGDGKADICVADAATVSCTRSP